MLYISITLIITGLVILALSIKSDKGANLSDDARRGETRRDKTPVLYGEGHGDGMNVKSVRTLYGDDTQGGNTGLAEIKLEGSDSDVPLPDNTAEDVLSESGAPAVTVGQADEGPVAYFEDSSGAVDYSSSSISLVQLGVDYSRIKRIASGRLSHDESGMSLVAGKKFYRFDFHRSGNFKSGANYIALIPSTEGPVKLFLFERGADIINSIAENYNSFMKV